MNIREYVFGPRCWQEDKYSPPLSHPPWGEGRNPWKRDKVIAVQSMKYAGGHTVRGVGRRWKWRRALTRRERGRKEGGRKIRQGLAWTRLGGGFPRIISFNYWKMSGWITSYLLLSFFFFCSFPLLFPFWRTSQLRDNFEGERISRNLDFDFSKDQEKVGVPVRISILIKCYYAPSIINKKKKYEIVLIIEFGCRVIINSTYFNW